ncbi:MAG: ABC transporter substrate-binding protein [Pseudomonadota bacterium]
MRWVLACLLAPVLAGADAPQRVVSAGGDPTEIVVALGDRDKLVGVGTTSRHPPGISLLASIGHVRRLSPEGLRTLEPDLVLGSHDIGPLAAGVAFAPDGRGTAAVPDKIDVIVGRLERETEALSAATWAEREAVAETIAAFELARNVPSILAVRDCAPSVGGAETPAYGITTLAGGIDLGHALGRTPCHLLDEPTASLDVAHRIDVMRLACNEAARGAAVAVILHDLNRAAAGADQIALMDEGRMIVDGPPDRVFTAERQTATYRTEITVRPGRSARPTAPRDYGPEQREEPHHVHRHEPLPRASRRG